MSTITRGTTNIAAILALVAGAVGCVNFTKEYPERSYYSIEARRPGERLASTSNAVLAVREFQTPPAFGGTQLVYRRGENQFESDFYNQLFQPAGAMIANETRDWLAESGLFLHVVPSGSIVEPGFVLEGNVKALYGDFRNAAEPKAVLDVQIFLLRNDDAGARVVHRGDYLEQVPIPEPTAAALVQGWHQGLDAALQKLEAELRNVDLGVGKSRP